MGRESGQSALECSLTRELLHCANVTCSWLKAQGAGSSRILLFTVRRQSLEATSERRDLSLRWTRVVEEVLHESPIGPLLGNDSEQEHVLAWKEGNAVVLHVWSPLLHRAASLSLVSPLASSGVSQFGLSVPRSARRPNTTMSTHPCMTWEEEEAHYWSRMRNNPGLTPIVLSALFVEDENEDPFSHLVPTIRYVEERVSTPKTNLLKNVRQPMTTTASSKIKAYIGPLYNQESISYTQWVKGITWDAITFLTYLR